MPIGSIFNDTLIGNNSSEVFWALAGDDLVLGRGGNDSILGDLGNDRLYGEDGNDTVDGGAGNDYISGGSGNDSLIGGGGSDTIYGGTGNDVIRSSGAGFYDGQDGNDYVYAGLGLPETLRGGAGTDWLNTATYNGNYTINMTTGATNFAGESFTQFENLYTGSGNDSLTGTVDANRIYSNAGNDTVDGGAGNDYISGGSGNDSLIGGVGNDTLAGGEGRDDVTGGGGLDVFRFFSTAESDAASGYDRILDFQGAGINLFGMVEDRIDLSAIDANTNVNAIGNQTFVFTGTTAGGAGTIWMQNVGGETWLRVNTDNDAVAEMTVRILDGADDANDYWAGDFVL